MNNNHNWWRVTDDGNTQLLCAKFRRVEFSRHAHEEFAFGVIEAGALAFRYRGKDVVAPAGSVILAFPGEPHTGMPGMPEGWSYRMFYIEKNVLLRVAQGLNRGCKKIPFISAGVLHDPDLASRIAQLHRYYEDPLSEMMTREILMGSILEDLITRYTTNHPERLPSKERVIVLRAMRYLEDSYDQSIRLSDLAALTGVNPYRLVRCFTRELGIPPHAYLVQVRLRRAMCMIRKGVSLAQVAVDTGFTDQSHLNRHFVRRFGLTPRAFLPARALHPSSEIQARQRQFDLAESPKKRANEKRSLPKAFGFME